MYLEEDILSDFLGVLLEGLELTYFAFAQHLFDLRCDFLPDASHFFNLSHSRLSFRFRRTHYSQLTVSTCDGSVNS